MSTAPRVQWPSNPRLLVIFGIAHRWIRAPSAVGVRHSGQDVLQVLLVLGAALAVALCVVRALLQPEEGRRRVHATQLEHA